MGHARNSSLSEKKKSGNRLPIADNAVQYGAICFRFSPNSERAIEVLLITSRDTGRWVIPKGWGMAKKRSFEVAKQEAWEEAGMKGRVWKRSLGSYKYPKVLEGGDVVLACVRVHLILVTRIEEFFPEKGQRTLRWFVPAEAAEAANEPDLKNLLGKVPDEIAKLLRRGFKHGPSELPVTQAVQ
ncbi:8-oxo-dGTP pyrophosphatase MutT (NUDIX family) [Rhizobium sp. BK077]|uniref:NUDIX hydrolase n=1 Tax=unclassified Rhizobium TaxID=2613769 RepID=UPI0016192D03|nr:MULTISPECIES: NUDIX hydrolase [unclassified Rhizobium]MBB3302203.1 8-oxo-dGTP pyrophosphatase MutT (NUDIX family) [Rhizobium sp. BK112]MBB3371325.1 8-oxo-dGTP pyrophosphatase MutT (NUDIX family) [Rhizobium sp. BK077]MBB4182187.1 8-oxo-dGTP pyrophosphatase MutT (NUDIX family) [Rhizobium sp. BK109]MBB4255616.1 8-oxo-dGTP pyrophosphatase MutT (NUDIX family) [Rhizobium sp. BK008]